MTDALRRGQAADERDDVVRGRPGRLGDDEDRRRARDRATSGPRSAPTAAARRRGLGEDRRARLGRRAARPSRRPPGRARRRRTRPVRTVASTPPGFVRTLIRVAAPASLNRIATSAVLGLGEQVDDPLRMRRAAVPVAARSASSSWTTRSGRHRRSPAGRGRGRTGVAAHPAWSGRGGARCPTAARPPRPAPPRRPAFAASRSGGRTSRCP